MTKALSSDLTVTISVGKLVQITSNDGGYLSGFCLCCEEYGWINGPDNVEGLGTERIVQGPASQLNHRTNCPVRDYIIRRKASV